LSFSESKISISNVFCTPSSPIFIFRAQKFISNPHCTWCNKVLLKYQKWCLCETKSSIYIVENNTVFFWTIHGCKTYISLG
jgi:hypothetical protein